MELEYYAGHTGEEPMAMVAQWEPNPAWEEAALRLRDRKEKLPANTAREQAAPDLGAEARFPRFCQENTS